MKTIIHLELSDEDRSDLMKRIRRDSVTKDIATRNDIKELVFQLINHEIERGREQEFEEVEQVKTCEQTPETQVKPDAYEDGAEGDNTKEFKEVDDSWDKRHIPPGGISPEFKPSRGDEPYLFKSKDPELTKRCTAILDATGELNDYVWHCLEENRT